MAILDKKWLVFCVSGLMVSAIYAEDQSTVTAPASSSAVSTLSHQLNKNDLLEYVNDVFEQAGFSDAVRLYLVGVAKGQLSQVTARDLADKQRLLKRNLSVFISNISEKNATPSTLAIVHQQYYLANQTNKPWEYILSSPVLAIFKSNHIFDQLQVSDIEDSNAKFCPVWPFCKE